MQYSQGARAETLKRFSLYSPSGEIGFFGAKDETFEICWILRLVAPSISVLPDGTLFSLTLAVCIVPTGIVHVRDGERLHSHIARGRSSEGWHLCFNAREVPLCDRGKTKTKKNARSYSHRVFESSNTSKKSKSILVVEFESCRNVVIKKATPLKETPRLSVYPSHSSLALEPHLLLHLSF